VHRSCGRADRTTRRACCSRHRKRASLDP
jgi:hypothetical protein